MFSTVLSADALLFPHLIGKQGAKKARLEQETGMRSTWHHSSIATFTTHLSINSTRRYTDHVPIQGGLQSAWHHCAGKLPSSCGTCSYTTAGMRKQSQWLKCISHHTVPNILYAFAMQAAIRSLRDSTVLKYNFFVSLPVRPKS